MDETSERQEGEVLPGRVMTELDYINATNLAKIRAAKAILRDILPMNEREDELLTGAFYPLTALEDRYAEAAKVTTHPRIK